MRRSPSIVRLLVANSAGLRSTAIGAVLLGCNAAATPPAQVAAPPTGAHRKPAWSPMVPEAQFDAVSQAASECLSDTAHRFSVSVPDGVLIRVEVDLDFSQLTVPDNTPVRGVLRNLRAQGTAIAEQVHAQLYARACELLEGAGCNPENLLQVNLGGELPVPDRIEIVSEYALPEQWADDFVNMCQDVELHFWGSRLTWAWTPLQLEEDLPGISPLDNDLFDDAGAGERTRDADARDPAATVTVKIVPSRPEYSVGENIQYTVYVENVSPFMVALPIHEVSKACFKDVAGNVVTIGEKHGLYFPDPRVPPDPMFAGLFPGDKRRFSTRIATVSDIGRGLYVELQPGTWTLSIPDLAAVCNVRVICPDPVEIVINPAE